MEKWDERWQTAGYLDPNVDGLILVRKNCGTPVRQKIALADKRKLCWEVPPTSCCKRDMTRPAALDRGSLAVWALKNVGTGREFLLGNGQP